MAVEELQQVDELAVLELGERRQLPLRLDPDELDATVRRLSRLFEEVRVTLEQGAEVLLRFLFGRPLRRGADLRSEGDPPLLFGALGRDRDLHVTQVFRQRRGKKQHAEIIRVPAVAQPSSVEKSVRRRG